MMRVLDTYEETNVLPGFEGVLLLSSLHVVLGPCGTENLREGAKPAPEVAVSSSPLQTMARRRVLLFLKPFDVYPPRPLAGASLSTSPPPAAAASRRKPQGPHLSRSPSPFREPFGFAGGVRGCQRD
jgi:hypothetical protein